jgi:hypothetical protein
MQENKDKFPRMEKSHTALVSSILRCAECGSPMSVNYGHKKPDGGKGYYYICTLRKKSKGVRCSNGNTRADLVDQAVINELKNRGLNKKIFLHDLEEQLKHNRKGIAINPVELIKSDIDKRSKEVKRLVERISKTDNNDMAVEYERLIGELKKDIISLSAELSAIGDKKTVVYDIENALSFMEKLLDECSMIDKLELEAQRKLVKALFKRIMWNSKTESLEFVFISDNNGDDDGGGGGNYNSGGDFDGGEYSSLEAVLTSGEMSYFNQSRS